jgi:hypothetical protein
MGDLRFPVSVPRIIFSPTSIFCRNSDKSFIKKTVEGIPALQSTAPSLSCIGLFQLNKSIDCTNLHCKTEGAPRSTASIPLNLASSDTTAISSTSADTFSMSTCHLTICYTSFMQLVSPFSITLKCYQWYSGHLPKLLGGRIVPPTSCPNQLSNSLT